MTQFKVNHLEKSDFNEKEGLYQFIVTFSDGAKGRAHYVKKDGWTIDGVNRLLNIPCPLCRKDYYCSCFDRNKEKIDQAIRESGLLPE